ncbi:MAG TPA: hypothetical protein DD640_10495, partial [Clostridiales bacterium]|nr:hypothetical protein [Clostridiales bacterium]
MKPIPRPARTPLPGNLEKVRMLFIIDGILINVAIVLTSGVFLSGYIILLGGSDLLVGLLNNSLSWAPVVALFSFLIFEKMEKRKAFLLILLSLSRLLVGSTIFLPLIFGTSAAVLTLLTVMVILGNMLWGIYSVGQTIWMMSSFPQGIRSEFIYQRIFWLRVAYTLATIIMGYVLDATGKSYTGFLIAFAASLVLSAANVVTLFRTPEPANPVQIGKRIGLKAFLEPLTQKSFRNYLIFIFLFFLCLTASTSYTSLYLIRYLQFDYKFISTITVISYIFMIVLIKPWNKAAGRIGQKNACRLAGLFITIELLIYGFLTRDTYFILYFAPIFAGIG